MSGEEFYNNQEYKKGYDELVMLYQCGLNSVVTLLQNLKAEDEMFGSQFELYHRIEFRIKSWKSVCDKCAKKEIEPTKENIQKNILDLAGIRVITLFEDDIYRVYEAVSHNPNVYDIPGRKPRDYVKDPKQNGYRGFHYNIEYSMYWNQKSVMVPVELQIRDGGMDLWAALEWVLKYKNLNPSEGTVKIFKSLSRILSFFGKKAMKLRDQCIANNEAA